MDSRDNFYDYLVSKGDDIYCEYTILAMETCIRENIPYRNEEEDELEALIESDPNIHVMTFDDILDMLGFEDETSSSHQKSLIEILEENKVK